MEGYYLELIEKDTTDQAKNQVGLYGNESVLNTYYCKKDCEEGFYYDFNSISCRRCPFGCSSCHRYELCDQCVPGFMLYQTPQHGSMHQVDKEMVNHCHIGCQHGFYLKGFNGTCLECDENCLECIDSVFTLKEEFVRTVSRESYCLRCAPRVTINRFTSI